MNAIKDGFGVSWSAVGRIAPLAMLMGCTSTQDITPQQVMLMQEQMRQSTLEINCPSGCSIKYRDPRDKVVIPKNTNANDAIIGVSQSVERLAGALIVPAAMSYIAVEGFKRLDGSGATTTTTTNIDQSDNSTADNSVHTSTSYGDYAGDGSGSVGDYSGDRAGNSGNIIDDNSGRVGSPDDYTSPPVVVPQPEPIVVTQPPPLVVTQP